MACAMRLLPAVCQIGAGLGREYADDSGAYVEYHDGRAVLLLCIITEGYLSGVVDVMIGIKNHYHFTADRQGNCQKCNTLHNRNCPY